MAVHLTHAKDGWKISFKRVTTFTIHHSPPCLSIRQLTKPKLTSPNRRQPKLPSRNIKKLTIGGGFNYFLFSPLGKMISILTNIFFQLGWFGSTTFSKFLRSTAFVAFFVRCTAVPGRSCWNFFGFQRAS